MTQTIGVLYSPIRATGGVASHLALYYDKGDGNPPQIIEYIPSGLDTVNYGGEVQAFFKDLSGNKLSSKLGSLVGLERRWTGDDSLRPQEVLKRGDDLSTEWSIIQGTKDQANLNHYAYLPWSQNSDTGVGEALTRARIPLPTGFATDANGNVLPVEDFFWTPAVSSKLTAPPPDIYTNGDAGIGGGAARPFQQAMQYILERPIQYRQFPDGNPQFPVASGSALGDIQVAPLPGSNPGFAPVTMQRGEIPSGTKVGHANASGNPSFSPVAANDPWAMFPDASPAQLQPVTDPAVLARFRMWQAQNDPWSVFPELEPASAPNSFGGPASLQPVTDPGVLARFKMWQAENDPWSPQFLDQPLAQTGQGGAWPRQGFSPLISLLAPKSFDESNG
jgi:hypothetical protein